MFLKAKVMPWHVVKSPIDFLLRAVINNACPSTLMSMACQNGRVQIIYWMWPSDTIWAHSSGSTMAYLIASCLTSTNYYLKQCWFIISDVLWHSPKSDTISVCIMSLKIILIESLPYDSGPIRKKDKWWRNAHRLSENTEWRNHTNCLYMFMSLQSSWKWIGLMKQVKQTANPLQHRKVVWCPS